MNRQLKNNWPLIGIGFLLVVLSLYLIRARSGITGDSLLKDRGAQEGLRLKDIHYTQNDPEKMTKWVLDAKEVTFSPDKNYFTFTRFKLKLKPENRPSIELEGKSGHYDKNSGEINLHGDLLAHSDNGYRIVTQRLQYKQKEGCLRTEEAVKIFGPFFSVVGRGLYLNPETETLRIFSDVTARIDGDSLIL